MIRPSYYKLYDLFLGLLVGADLGRQRGHQLVEKRWVFLPLLGELQSVEAVEGIPLLHFLDVEEQHFFESRTEATFIMLKELGVQLAQGI